MQFKQWVESSERMVKALSTLAGTIGPNQRIHLSNNKLEAINDKSQGLEPEHFRVNGKPFGLWYGVGSQWIDFAVNEYPKAAKVYVYEMTVDLPKVLIVEDSKHAEEIEKDFGVWSDFGKHGWYDGQNGLQQVHSNGQITERPKLIDWQKAGEHYYGVELDPEKVHSYWSDRWDVHSGCIWNKAGVISFKLIAEYDPNAGVYQLKNI